MGRARSRSLTTMRYSWPLRMAISSTPIALGAGRTRPRELPLHVELVEVLHGAVVQTLDLGDRLVRHVAAELPDMKRETLGVTRILRKPVELLYEHAVAPRAPDAPAPELEIDAPVGGTHIANADDALVVAATATTTAA